MRDTVPLMERFRFLSIFSSNLDEFYRVRMPTLMLVREVDRAESNKYWGQLQEAKQVIYRQQNDFGKTLREVLIPELSKHGIELLYNKSIPLALEPLLREYFQSELMAFLEIVNFSKIDASFFAKNNVL